MVVVVGEADEVDVEVDVLADVLVVVVSSSDSLVRVVVELRLGEQAVWAPYGNEEFTTFLSERMNFDKSYHHLLFNQDYSSFAVK